METLVMTDSRIYTLANEGEFDDIEELSNKDVSHKWEVYNEGTLTIDNFSVGIPYDKLRKALTITPEAEYYLSKNGVIETYLLEIFSLIKSFFKDEKVVLSIYEDTEDEMEDQINFTILTNKAPKEALNLLDQFDDKSIELVFDLDNIMVDIEYL